MSKSKQKLLLIDGNAIIHRSFHALPPSLKTKKGTLVNAVYGFTSFLLSAITEFKPQYVVLTLDKKGSTFRHEEYKEYKANRSKAPDELYDQIPLIKKVAQAFSIPIFEKTGFEADDLIGTLSAQAEKEKNLETIIVTGDLDTLQLVSEKTKVYTASRGISESVLYDQQKVENRYKLGPEQIIDLKALAGDPSDNIPGAQGIGLKTATQLLLDFDNVENLYKNLSQSNSLIKDRIKNLLKESKDNVFLSKALATIDRQAPVKLDLEKSQFANFDLNKVLKIFSELEFKSLLKKTKALRDLYQIKKVNSEQEKQVQEDRLKLRASQTNYKFIRSKQEFSDFLKLLKTKKSFSLSIHSGLESDCHLNLLDQNFNKLPEKIKDFGISFSWKRAEAWCLFLNLDWYKQLKPILEDKNILKSSHNLKSLWHSFKQIDIEIQGLDFDLMIASYLLNPGERQHDLDSLAFLELNWDKLNKTDIGLEQKGQLNFNFTQSDPEKISLLLNENADISHQLKSVLSKRLLEADLDKVFRRIELPLVPVLAEMEHNGIKVDLKILKKLNTDVGKRLQKIEKDVFELAQQEFNLNSPKQLQEVLFTDLKISTQGIKKTKTGFSTAEEELNKLMEAHPIISLIQNYRELKKIETTYLNALPKLVNQNTGKIHTNFNQAITATGRLSSADPNLQNIPTRSKEGQEIRKAFVAEKGYKFLGLDYSQIELRLAAHMSKDKAMINAFLNNIDIHSSTAAAINQIDLRDVSPEQRQEAKATNFGILYGQGPHGLSQTAGISYFNAQEFIKRYFISYPGVKKMVDGFISQAQKNTYAQTLFGRKRPLLDINSSLPMAKRGAERMAINTPIQGTAADLIKLAMIKIYELISQNKDEVKLLLQVHDELIFEIKEDKIDFYLPQLKSIMENVIKLQVPIIVDSSIGSNWAELK